MENNLNTKNSAVGQGIIDHIGIVVPDLDQAIRTYTTAFPCSVSEKTKLLDRHLELVFLEYDNTKIEFLAPLSDESTISKFLKNKGSGLHHICYQVSNIKQEIEKLKNLKYELVDEIPRFGVHGLIAFLQPKGFEGVLVELLEICADPDSKE
jgi:methylmalonyl-CoA/ethylmalonyl-CoA epimerase